MKIYLDSTVILNFIKPYKDNHQIHRHLITFVENRKKNQETVITTTYIYEEEIKYPEEAKEEVFLFVEKEEVPFDFYSEEPPPNIDLGEWSIWQCAKKKLENSERCCVLSDDSHAREFFSNKELLPCRYINPPKEGVGGTMGILIHLKEEQIISEDEYNQLINTMKKYGARLPVKKTNQSNE
ncbi:hypothetical protein [Persephonella sp.]|uniref:hypothetical protein n=1 Tax=Persephonella sp. TaxID=2060922 RepID=UPI002618FD3A|nr:hypothetical protein [Persephonella sp.]